GSAAGSSGGFRTIKVHTASAEKGSSVLKVKPTVLYWVEGAEPNCVITGTATSCWLALLSALKSVGTVTRDTSTAGICVPSPSFGTITFTGWPTALDPAPTNSFPFPPGNFRSKRPASSAAPLPAAIVAGATGPGPGGRAFCASDEAVAMAAKATTERHRVFISQTDDARRAIPREKFAFVIKRGLFAIKADGSALSQSFPFKNPPLPRLATPGDG